MLPRPRHLLWQAGHSSGNLWPLQHRLPRLLLDWAGHMAKIHLVTLARMLYKILEHHGVQAWGMLADLAPVQVWV